MKIRFVFAILALSAFSVGLDCQGTTPAPMALQVPDGAYAGVLLTKSDVRSPDEAPTPATGTRYVIVEIVGGNIARVRTAADQNGPFDCWKIQPGSERTIGAIVFGGDSNFEETVVEVGVASFKYASSFTFDGIVLTGEGEVVLSSRPDGTIAYDESASIIGNGLEGESSATGALSRIGDLGTVPVPQGMNGYWRMVNTRDASAIAVIGIQSLRVVQFQDGNGQGNVLSSQPVTGTDVVGSHVFVAFSVEQGGVGGTFVNVTFQGEVTAPGRVAGHATAEFPGQPNGEYDIVLERLESSDCS